MIEFRLPIEPPRSTSQGKRMVIVQGRPMFFKKKQHQQAENDLLMLCTPHRPVSPLTGPVALEIEFVVPWRKGEPKRNLRYPRLPMDAGSDCDNMAKLIGDVLTKLQFYRDDKQVAHLCVTKFWGHEVGIRIALRPIAIGQPMPEKADELQPTFF